jgi:hypothetical protein
VTAVIPTYSPDALRAALKRHDLTGSQAGRLLGVDSRTIRKWCSPPDSPSHRAMPESAWWLLLILTGDITVPALLAYLTGPAE